MATATGRMRGNLRGGMGPSVSRYTGAWMLLALTGGLGASAWGGEGQVEGGPNEGGEQVEAAPSEVATDRAAAEPPASPVVTVDGLAERLGAVYRRLYVASPADRRGAILLELLGDEVGSLRRLGLELARRDLSSGAAPGEAVIDGAIGLLADPDPALRAEAARLIAEAGTDRAAVAVAAALERETDPKAGAALVRAAARWPTAEHASLFFLWLQRGPVARQAAIEALWASARAGVLGEDGLREAVRTELRATPTAELSSAGMRLLAATGTGEDRGRLASLLMSESAAVRFQTAEALAEYPDHAEAVLSAAESDGALASSAARAVAARGADPALLLRTLALPFESAGEAERETEGVIGSASVASLLEAARKTTDEGVRVRLSSAAVSRLMAPSLGDEEDDADAGLLASACLMLAEAQLAVDRPDDALATLDRGAMGEGGSADRAVRLRLEALVRLGRTGDAGALDLGPGVWLSTLERIVEAERALEGVRFVRTRFGASLSDVERARLAALERRLVEATAPPANRDGAGAAEADGRPDEMGGENGAGPSGGAAEPQGRGSAIPPA